MFDPSYASCVASLEMTIKVPEKKIRDDEMLGRSVFSGRPTARQRNLRSGDRTADGPVFQDARD